MSRGCRVVLALVAVVTAAVPATARAASPDPVADWLALVRAHEAGTMDQAATSLAAWDPDQVVDLLPVVLAKIDASTLIRGLSVHTDIALAQQATMARPAVGSRTAVVLLDGRPVETIARSQQWRICWRLASGLAARRDQATPLAGWFRAAAAVLQQLGDYDLLDHHLGLGLRLFPQDATLALYAGTLHQTFADPRVQQFVARRRTTPPGRRLITSDDSMPGPPGSKMPPARLDLRRRLAGDAALRNEPRGAAAELKVARELFERALRIDPARHEARIRLAHVLGDLGEQAQAAAMLREALAAPLVPFFEFYAAVILGRCEEQLGNLAAAGEAYARAAARFPGAQSAELGRSRVALAQGRAREAVAIAVAVAGPAADERLDPWSSYFVVHDPDAGTLLADWRGGLR